jgi:excinuclease UvrABC ATPase subunit
MGKVAEFTKTRDGSIKCVLPNGRYGFGKDEQTAQYNAAFFPVGVEVKCKECDGDGWYVGTDQCGDQIQVQCEYCQATGKVQEK